MTRKTTAADTAYVSGNPVPAPVARGMNRGLTLLFATVEGAAAGSLYRAEPLPGTIAGSPHISSGSAAGSRSGAGATTGSIRPAGRSPAGGRGRGGRCGRDVSGTPRAQARHPAWIALARLRAQKPWIAIPGTRRLQRREEHLAADVETTVTDRAQIQAAGDAVGIPGGRSPERLERQVEK